MAVKFHFSCYHRPSQYLAATTEDNWASSLPDTNYRDTYPYFNKNRREKVLDGTNFHAGQALGGGYD